MPVASAAEPYDSRIELKDGTMLQVVKVLSQRHGIEGTRIVKARNIVDNTGNGLADRELVVKIGCARELSRFTSPLIAVAEREPDNSTSRPKMSRRFSDGLDRCV